VCLPQVNLIIQSPQDWQTGMMLPFTQIEGTTVECTLHCSNCTALCAFI
jgi:hypothetical protein